MIIPIPILYTVSNFLMDQKDSLKRLDAKKRAHNSSKHMEIQEQKEYLYNQGLQALHRHRTKIPTCVRTYYLDNAREPSINEINSELRKMNRYRDYKFKRVIRIMVISIFAILLLFALSP